MRAHTITTMSRRMRQRRRRALALAAGICALVVPATASAQPIDSTPVQDDTQATGGSYSSLNSIAPPTSEPSSSPASSGSGYASLNSITGAPESTPTVASSSPTGSGYASLNSITGAPESTPTVASSSPSSASDGFDWASAVVGAGASLALAALAGAALLSMRRRHPVTPSPSTG